MHRNNKQQGATSIILALLILSMILVIAVGISVLMIQQIKSSGLAASSVVALYVADAGAERCLFDIRKGSAVDCPFTDVSLDFDNSATYTTSYNGTDQILSIGRFDNTNRKIELNW